MSTDFAHCAYWTAVPWPPAVASVDDAGRSARRPRPPGRGVAASAIAAYGRDAGPGRLLDGVDLGDQQRGGREVAAERGGLTARVVGDGEDLERAGVAGELHRARADLEAAVVVPHEVRRPRRQPPPAEHLLHGDVGARERGDRAPQHRRGGGAPVGEDQRQAVQQQVARKRSASGSGAVAAARETSSRLPPAPASRPANSAAPHASRYVSRARRTSSGSSFLRGLQQQQRSVAAAVLGERDLGPEQLDARAPELVQRPGLRGRQEPVRHVERPGPEARLRGGERSLGPPRGIAGQRDRALQERGRGGQAAARLRPAGRALELRGDLLVGPGRRGRQMPRTAVRVDVPVGRLRQRRDGRPGAPPPPPTGRRRSAPADGGTSRARRSPAARPLARRPRSPARCRAARPRARAAADRRPAPPPRAAADAARHRGAAWSRRTKLSSIRPESACALSSPKPPASCAARQAPRQLEQRQRVAARLGDDPVAHALVQLEPHRRARAARGRPRCAGRAPPARGRARAPRPARARRTRSRPARPAGGGRRRRASAPTRDRATARRRRRTAADAPRPRPRTGSAPPGPTRNRSGAAPALSPNTISSACRCGAGSRSSRSSIGPHS